MATAARSETNLTITREFDAPRDLVWKAWTETEHIKEWFGPEGFTTRVKTNDVVPGGKFDYAMIGPDGTEYPGTSIFKEIVAPEKIVATDDFGEEMKAENPDLPGGMIVTTTFEDLGGSRTRVVISTEHASAEDKKKHEDMGVVAGWNSSLDKFERVLAKLR